jgi:Tfp pilus assembly protein PilO
MKKYFAQLRPLERRLAIGVVVVVFLVLNYVFIWPHFSDWGNLSRRREAARTKLKLYQTAIAQTDACQKQVDSLQSKGEFVELQNQGVNMLRTIQTQSAQSGVGIANNSRQITRTNDAFFVEQVQNITVLADDEKLVDFLYKLGSGASMIRVRDLEMQPDSARQHLNANIRLVASYQKNASAAGQKTPPAAPAATLKPATAKAK